MTTIQPTHQTNHNNKISHTAIAATSLGLVGGYALRWAFGEAN